MAAKNAEVVSVLEVEVGDTIEYRGQKAVIVARWRRQRDSPLNRMISPVGLEVEWGDNGVGEPHRTRLVWPELEREESKLDRHKPAEVRRLLDADVAARPVKRIGRA